MRLLVRIRWMDIARERTLCTGEMMIPFLHTSHPPPLFPRPVVIIVIVEFGRKSTFARVTRPSFHVVGPVVSRARAIARVFSRISVLFRRSTQSVVAHTPPRAPLSRSVHKLASITRAPKRGSSTGDLYRSTHAAVEVTIKFSACTHTHSRIPNILL
jgi:hypothetical protein